MKIENSTANDLLLSAKRGEKLQEFMDAISGVPNYRLDNINRQGHIRSMFSKELISDQFLVDLEDVISVFWCGVFEHLDKAKLHGEVVKIKYPGSTDQFRQTDNNPIHYLRYHGRMAVRNYLSYLYRRNLQQGCPNCGYKNTIRNNKICPHCSTLMITIYKFTDIDKEESISYEDTHKNVENNELSNKLNNLLHAFAENELKRGTRAYQILKILIDPSESINMCANCRLCDSNTFNIDTCTNYNANIGNWLGVNKTMIASKIRRIRNAFPKWLLNQDNDESSHILQILPQRYKILQ